MFNNHIASSGTDDVCFGELELKNSLFYSPILLPGIKAGTSKFTVKLSELSERLCIDPDFTSFASIQSECFFIDNLEYEALFTNRLKPPADQTGSIIYEVDPPGKGLIHRLSINGSFSHEPRTGGNDSFRIFYAVDRPDNWELLW